MDNKKHLLLSVPDEWENTAKGKFFEGVVSEILSPLRYKVTEQIRVTGMEIDLLAKGEDQPRTILVECKSQRDPLAADVIPKLMGNTQIRKADEGWLFSTSDLSKDGRGSWEEIQQDPDLRKKFTWYSPSRIIEIFIQQKTIINPETLIHHLPGFELGGWTLVITPSVYAWLVEIIEEGIPTKYSVFDARSGSPLSPDRANSVATISARFESLKFVQVTGTPTTSKDQVVKRAPVAMVISGDSWEDPRPARPSDFVGRDELIEEINGFIDAVKDDQSSTRNFAIVGPSGWGKSSLILKLVDLATKKKRENLSITAIDTRSATNTAFVSESIRLAFLEAKKKRILPQSLNFNVSSLRDPLDSPDITSAIDSLRAAKKCIVIVFDQFEELFAREDLFEIFAAVKELSLDIDARQAPIVLGFAWKTDISLPQQHPAYHLWHQLADRRRTFKIREFGGKDIVRIINKAQKVSNRTLISPLRNRLQEQCQGFPWLLKKLLVHILQRIGVADSQYLLLERELDIEQLFKDDLSVLGDEQIRCLKYVATKGPVAVAEVEENFSKETTNYLLRTHLLVRSGMNYVVYWDIFRDYLVEEKVPYIPWAKTFQRGPSVGLKALSILTENQPVTAMELATSLGIKEVPCFNLLADLVALQLVDSDANGHYSVSKHLSDLNPMTIAKFVQGQLRRHVVVSKLGSTLEKGTQLSLDQWPTFFKGAYPRSATFSPATINVYSGNLKSWLLFSGLLEQKNNWVFRSPGQGNRMGIVPSMNLTAGTFLGCSAPTKYETLLKRLFESREGVERPELEKVGLRNAITDGLALGTIYLKGKATICLRESFSEFRAAIDNSKKKIKEQETIQNVENTVKKGLDLDQTGLYLKEQMGTNWKDVSARRYANGLRKYLEWSNKQNPTSEFALENVSAHT